MAIISYSALDQILCDAEFAFRYAEENYALLRNRKPCFTLYGPETIGIGAANPSHLTKDADRYLQQKTRRKNFTTYEFDCNFRLLCNKHIENKHLVESIYYFFELNGIIYARSFLGESSHPYTRTIDCIKFIDDRPVFYAQASPSMLYIELYDLLEEGQTNRFSVTSIHYFPTRAYSEEGIPLSKHSPIGSKSSPTSMCCFEKQMPMLDFSDYFMGNYKPNI